MCRKQVEEGKRIMNAKIVNNNVGLCILTHVSNYITLY